VLVHCCHSPTVLKQKETTVNKKPINYATAGISFGAALAITISWSVNKSILWAIIHGLFSWIYVAYYAVT
jgi:hypothetical protein